MTEQKQKHKENRKRIFESRRFKVMAFCAMAAILIGSTATFAWYGVNEREADSASAEVMKPYYLTLLNPSESHALQLSIGNLFPGDVKQIVFCVSNKNNEGNEGLEMGVTTFDYSIELIHTENLALEYKIYELTKVDENTENAITALDTITVKNENDMEVVRDEITYWKKVTENPLSGTDVSKERHKQTGLRNEEGTSVDAEGLPVNAGKYTSYTEGSSGTLKLTAGENDDGSTKFDSQYFLLEIAWKEGADADFDRKYKKETDMIYLLVEALQPKPEKDTAQTPTE